MKLRYLFLIFFLGFFLRVFHIANTPPAIMPDEIDYALSAKSVAYFGKDLSLKQDIFQLKPFKTETAMAELGPLFQLPAMALFPTSLLNAKIMPVIFSSIFILLVYLFVNKLFSDKTSALISSFLVAVNPWAIFIGRTGYEAPIALCFYTLSFVLLIQIFLHLKSPKKNFPYTAKTVSLGLFWYLSFFLAFFTYHGTKISGLGLTIVLTGYLIWKNRFAKSFIVGLVVILLSSSTFLVNTYSLIKNQTRTGEISILNLTPYASEADKQKRLNFNSSSLISSFLNNRYSIWFSDFVAKTISAYNPREIFMSGAEGWSAGLSNFGQFHIFESIFLFAGMYFLVKNKKFPEIILFCVSFPVVVFSYAIKVNLAYITLQGCLVLLIFISLMAYGLKNIFESFKSPKTKQLFAVGMSFAYLCSIIIWGHNYYERYPLYAEEQYNFKDRILSKYLNFLQTNQKKAIIIVPNPYGTFRNFIFYNNLYTKESAKELSSALQVDKENKSYKGFVFSNDCSLLGTKDRDTTVIVSSAMNESCARFKTSKVVDPIHIVALKDSGSNYQIFNDHICNTSTLKGFLLVQDRKAFDVESLKQDEFCNKWLIKYFNK